MWASLISQTGKELADICNDLSIYPNIILSTKPRELIHPDLEIIIKNNQVNFIFIPIESSKNSKILFKYLHGCSLVTLHGWLRIIPEALCEQLEIYNGHPGDIVEFPELKGFNPQEKAYKLKLSTSGSVVHRVTKEVDDGPILYRVITSMNNCSIDQVYERLRYTSLLAWKLFFTRKMISESAPFSCKNQQSKLAKFAITGAHCTGKTTLVNAIEEIDVSQKYLYITSMTREAKKIGYKINEAGNDETQLYILNKHLERLTINNNCVLDRSLIDGYTYTKILYEAGNISEVVMKYAKSLLNVEYMNRYDKIFYLPPTLQLENDGLRSTEPEFRRHVINNFDQIVQSASIFIPNLITTIDGTVQQRVQAANKFLNIK